jgi:hypothetical protein
LQAHSQNTAILHAAPSTTHRRLLDVLDRFSLFQGRLTIGSELEAVRIGRHEPGRLEIMAAGRT